MTKPHNAWLLHMPCLQVMVIAAGYDTRAYRFSRPGVRFFEVDLPHASTRKRELVHKLLPADKVRWQQQKRLTGHGSTALLH